MEANLNCRYFKGSTFFIHPVLRSRMLPRVCRTWRSNFGIIRKFSDLCRKKNTRRRKLQSVPPTNEISMFVDTLTGKIHALLVGSSHSKQSLLLRKDCCPPLKNVFSVFHHFFALTSSINIGITDPTKNIHISCGCILLSNSNVVSCISFT